MQIETKIQDPISIKLSKEKSEILLDNATKECLPIPPGAMLGGEHYGFILVSDGNKTQKEEIYPTSCRIVGVEIIDGTLRVHEDGKYHPWKFDMNGSLIEHAKFNEMSRRDWEYLRETFQGYSQEDMQQANTYRKR